MKSFQTDDFEKEEFFHNPNAVKFFKAVMDHPDWGKDEIRHAKNLFEGETVQEHGSPMAEIQKTWQVLQKGWHTLLMQFDSRYNQTFNATIQRIREAYSGEPVKRSASGINLSKIAIKEARETGTIRMSKMKLDALPELKMELERVRLNTLHKREKELDMGITEKKDAVVLLEEYLNLKRVYDAEMEKLYEIKNEYQSLRDEFQNTKNKSDQIILLKLGATMTQAEESLRIKNDDLNLVRKKMLLNPLLANQVEGSLHSNLKKSWEEEIQKESQELTTIESALKKRPS